MFDNHFQPVMEMEKITVRHGSIQSTKNFYTTNYDELTVLSE